MTTDHRSLEIAGESTRYLVVGTRDRVAGILSAWTDRFAFTPHRITGVSFTIRHGVCSPVNKAARSARLDGRDRDGKPIKMTSHRGRKGFFFSLIRARKKDIFGRCWANRYNIRTVCNNHEEGKSAPRAGQTIDGGKGTPRAARTESAAACFGLDEATAGAGCRDVRARLGSGRDKDTAAGAGD